MLIHEKRGNSEAILIRLGIFGCGTGGCQMGLPMKGGHK